MHRPTLFRCHPPHHMCAVLYSLCGVEGPLFARKALTYNTCICVDPYPGRGRWSYDCRGGYWHWGGEGKNSCGGCSTCWFYYSTSSSSGKSCHFCQYDKNISILSHDDDRNRIFWPNGTFVLLQALRMEIRVSRQPATLKKCRARQWRPKSTILRPLEAHWRGYHAGGGKRRRQVSNRRVETIIWPFAGLKIGSTTSAVKNWPDDDFSMIRRLKPQWWALWL